MTASVSVRFLSDRMTDDPVAEVCLRQGGPGFFPFPRPISDGQPKWTNFCLNGTSSSPYQMAQYGGLHDQVHAPAHRDTHMKSNLSSVDSATLAQCEAYQGVPWLRRQLRRSFSGYRLSLHALAVIAGRHQGRKNKQTASLLRRLSTTATQNSSTPTREK